MQFNVMSTETLKDALVHPENHRNLMCEYRLQRVLRRANRDLQTEIVERTEHALCR